MMRDITVLMPVYNASKYLKEAMDSVLNQSYSDFEFLIVNDGSTDDSEDIIHSYSDERIKLINRPNGGVSAALNTGLENASGQYIARFDADDICMPDRLEKQYFFLKNNPEYILVGSDADYVDEDGVFIFRYRNIGYTNEEIQERIQWHCPFIHSAVMYLKSKVVEAGAYEVKAHTFEDYFLWTKLIRLGKVHNLKEALIKVRFNPSSVSIDDKDCTKDFLLKKQEALKTGFITDEAGAIILKNVRQINPVQKQFSYYSLLGKKYLWNNYQADKARFYLQKALRLKPLKLNIYLLILISFLPAALIAKLYGFMKSSPKIQHS